MDFARILKELIAQTTEGKIDWKRGLRERCDTLTFSDVFEGEKVNVFLVKREKGIEKIVESPLFLWKKKEIK